MNHQQAWKAKLEAAPPLGVHNCKKIVCYSFSEFMR